MSMSSNHLRDAIIANLQTALGFTFTSGQLVKVQQTWGAIASAIIAEIQLAQVAIPSLTVPATGLQYLNGGVTTNVTGSAASTAATTTTGVIS